MISWILGEVFSKMFWSDSVRDRKFTILATAILGFLGVIGNPDQYWVWIVAFLCAFSIVWREWRRSDGLGTNYRNIVERVMRLIADLSTMTAGRFDLWVVDVYLPRSSITFLPPKRVCNLQLSLHVALKDVRKVPSKIESDHVLFRRCFNEHRSELWWDASFAPTSEENLWELLDANDNDQIRTRYGVISVFPLIDNLGKNCCGLLVVHAARDAEIVTAVLGALKDAEGKRRVTGACYDIYNQLETP